jgi:hypothetical protein
MLSRLIFEGVIESVGASAASALGVPPSPVGSTGGLSAESEQAALRVRPRKRARARRERRMRLLVGFDGPQS